MFSSTDRPNVQPTLTSTPWLEEQQRPKALSISPRIASDVLDDSLPSGVISGFETKALDNSTSSSQPRRHCIQRQLHRRCRVLKRLEEKDPGGHTTPIDHTYYKGPQDLNFTSPDPKPCISALSCTRIHLIFHVCLEPGLGWQHSCSMPLLALLWAHPSLPSPSSS